MHQPSTAVNAGQPGTAPLRLDVVAGLVVRHPDGREEIQSLRIGPKPDKKGDKQKNKAPKKEAPKKEQTP